MPYLREEIKAGTIIITAFLALSIAIISISGRGLLKENDIYYIKLRNVSGIDPGSQVRLDGVSVGSVLDIKPPQSPGEYVTVIVGLKKGTKLFQGTIGQVAQIGFIGDIYVLLSTENVGSQPLPVGSTLASVERIQMTDVMAKLQVLSISLNKLVNDVDELFSDKNKNEIGRLLENSNTMLGATTRNIDNIAQPLIEVSKGLHKTLGELHDLITGSKVDFKEILSKSSRDLERTGEILKSVEGMAKGMDSALYQQNANLDVLLKTMIKTTDELSGVLQDLQRKPYSILYKEGKGGEER